MYKGRWLISAVLMLLVNCASSKIFETTLPTSRIAKKREIYLTKFKFYKGGHFVLDIKPELGQAKPLHNIEIVLGLMDHDGFSHFETTKACEDKLAQAKVTYPISLETNSTFKHNYTHEGDLGASYTYFALFDCSQHFKNFKGNAFKLKVFLDMRSSNQASHFEAGEERMIHYYTIAAFVFIAVFALQSKQFYKEMIKKQNEEANYAYLIVNASLILKIVSLVLDIIDLYAVSSDGSGYTFINFLSQSTNHLSQYLLTVLLIILAKGWTVLFQSLDDLELFMPIAVLIGIFKVLIIGLGKMEDNSAMFFHRYDSFIGWILAAFNVGLYVYFLIGAIESLKQSRSQGLPGNKTYNFFVMLTAFGTLYFFTFPALMLLSVFSSPENRTFIIEMGRIVSQMVALCLMTYVTGHKKGMYKQVMNFDSELPVSRTQ